MKYIRFDATKCISWILNVCVLFLKIEILFSGDIPGWLCGSLYRNGPGMYEVGEDKYKHWLDPLAMLQCFRIRK